MGLRRLASRPLQGFDISPLIDVVFILLIFFMVSSTFDRDQKLELQRPRAASAVVAHNKMLRVYIDRDQQIHVDRQPIRLWVLQGKVRKLLLARQGKAVLVVADQSVPSRRLIEVVDQIRLAGASEVGVATHGEPGT
jgi:biopolymer transport protein ExbD